MCHCKPAVPTIRLLQGITIRGECYRSLLLHVGLYHRELVNCDCWPVYKLGTQNKCFRGAKKLLLAYIHKDSSDRFYTFLRPKMLETSNLPNLPGAFVIARSYIGRHTWANCEGDVPLSEDPWANCEGGYARSGQKQFSLSKQLHPTTLAFSW